jgi:hypothetical protein
MRSHRTLTEFMGSRWEDRIVPAASLDYDAFDRRYVLNESAMLPIPVPVPVPPALRSRLRAVIPEPVRAPPGRMLRQTALLVEQRKPSRHS